MLKNTLLLTGIDASTKAVGFLLLPVYLNLMTKSEFGEYSYLLAALLVFPVILTLGMHVPLISMCSGSGNENYQKKAFSTTILITTILIITTGLLIGITGIYENIAKSIFSIEKNITLKSVASAIIVLFSSLNLIVYSFLIIVNDIIKIGIFNILKFINMSILSIVSIFIFTNIDASASRLVGVAISEVILFIIGTVWFTRGCLVRKFDYIYLLEACKIGLPIVPGTIATLITLMSDRYFISKHFDMSYVAEYSLAMMFLAPIQMVMASAQISIAPNIYKIKDKLEAHQKMILFFIKTFYTLIIIFAMIYILIKLSIKFAFIPETYNNISWLVLIFSIGVMGSVLLQITFNYFIYLKKSIFIFYITGLVAFFTVVGGHILIPKYGFNGAAINSGLVNVVMLYLSIKITYRYI